MIEAGEDPRFLARRLVILASEDIGLADPQALLVAEAAARAVEYVGLPEAALNLAEAVIYLARAPKSNAVVVALGRAQADVRSGSAQEVPDASARRPLQGGGHARVTGGVRVPARRPLRSRCAAVSSRRARGAGVLRADTPWLRRAATAKPEQGGRFVNRATAKGRGASGGRPGRFVGARCRSLAVPAPAGAAAPDRALLPQAVPPLPTARRTLGATPSGQILHLDVGLAGQDPAGLAQAVAAVSTPGSPSTGAPSPPPSTRPQFGPSPAEVAQVSTLLRARASRWDPVPGSDAPAGDAARPRRCAAFDTTDDVRPGARPRASGGQHRRPERAGRRSAAWSPAWPGWTVCSPSTPWCSTRTGRVEHRRAPRRDGPTPHRRRRGPRRHAPGVPLRPGAWRAAAPTPRASWPPSSA